MSFVNAFRRAATAILTVILFAGCVEDTDEALDGPAPAEIAADTAMADTAMAAADDTVTGAAADGNTLWAAIQQNERLTTMANLVNRVGLDGILQDSDASYTVFAPTDEAFNRLEQITLGSLRDADNDQLLREIVTAHLVEEVMPPQQLRQQRGILTAGETTINVEVVNDSIYVDKASVVNTVTTPDNGVIYLIDSVILPLEQSLREAEDAA